MKSWISFVQNKLSFVTTWSLLSTYQIQLLIELFLPNMQIETMVINSSSGIQGQHQRFKVLQE